MTTVMSMWQTIRSDRPPQSNIEMYDGNVDSNLNVNGSSEYNSRMQSVTNSTLSSRRQNVIPNPPSSTSPSFSSSAEKPLAAATECHDAADDRPEVERFALRLIDDVVDHVNNKHVGDYYEGHYAKYRAAMFRVVDELAKRHGDTFDEMILNLFTGIQPPFDVDDADLRGRRQETLKSVKETFGKIVSDMLSDKKCNWGRVTTIYTWAAWLVRRYREMEFGAGIDCSDDLIDDLKSFIGDVIVHRLTPWIGANGGWVEFERFFSRRNSPEAIIDLELPSWLSVMCVAVGFGAAAAAIIGGLNR